MPQPCQRSSRPSLPKPPARVVTVHLAPQGSAQGQAIRGIAAVIASRIGGLANANEILVSGTVRDLVGGSGIQFTDCGVRTLKGVPEPWNIYLAPGA
jgi:class 3 adenylate cyclase